MRSWFFASLLFVLFVLHVVVLLCFVFVVFWVWCNLLCVVLGGFTTSVSDCLEDDLEPFWIFSGHPCVPMSGHLACKRQGHEVCRKQFLCFFHSKNEKKQKDSRDRARVRQSLRICWFLLKEMRCLKKSGFVIKMDTAGFKPSFRYFLWVWSSSDVSNALKTWKMMICSPCWHSLGTLELYQKVYFLSLQLCIPLSNSSLHLWFCKEKRSEKSNKLFLITHQTEHKQSNHCLPEDQWFSEISLEPVHCCVKIILWHFEKIEFSTK